MEQPNDTLRRCLQDKATSLKLMSCEEGCSPALEPVNRIEGLVSPRASGSGGTGGRGGNFFKFRRCISMVERRTPVPASPDQRTKVSGLLDFTSPVSRNTFKRPAIPPSPDETSLAKKARNDDKVSVSQIFYVRNFLNVHNQLEILSLASI